MKPSDALDVAGMIVVVAGILVLTRPGSQGPKFVTAVGNAFSGALGVAVGNVPKGQGRPATR